MLPSFSRRNSHEDMKLYYFHGPGRAEVARILFTVGNVSFEDVRFSGEEWRSTYKSASPSSQCPWLEMDEEGSTLTQSSAINHYAASLAGFIPSDDLTRARVYELVGALEDVERHLVGTSSIKDEAERHAARQAMLADDGSCTKKLHNVERLLAQSTTKYYLTDDKPTLADIMAYFTLSMMRSRIMDGLTDDMFHKFPKLCDLHTRIANYPPIKDYYAGVEGRDSFKPHKQVV